MKRLFGFVCLLVCCSGCAMMEDMVLGPESYDGPVPTQASQGCGAPIQQARAVQTQEPELLQVRR